MTAPPPDRPYRLLQAAADAGLQLGPPSLSQADSAKIETLPRLRASFQAYIEAAPRHRPATQAAGHEPPTPFANRTVTAPWTEPTGRHQGILVVLRETHDHAIAAASKKVTGPDEVVHSVVFELEASCLTSLTRASSRP